ncbi:ubiquinol-cytochrome-c reductase complex assembly factor 1-like [Mytilus trossulus]|uniref:ubiquinol-cytochrome-c reductase complex assembly factor 1-like n=1 Tax=Mytilus trossulus TaxID=6551 RepID=UPI0030054F20
MTLCNMNSLRQLFVFSVRNPVLQFTVSRQISRYLPTVISPLSRPLDQTYTNHQCRCPVYSNIQSRTFIARLREKLLYGRGKLKYSKKHLMVSGTNLYFLYRKQINSIDLMEEIGLPDTFNSWYLVAELHVWMIMYRLAKEGEEGRHSRNGLVKAMWSDVDVRSRNIKEHGMAGRKNALYKLNDHFYTALLTYEEGIMGTDKDLASAVWNMLYSKKDIDPEKLSQCVGYIRKQIKYLEEENSSSHILGSGMIKLLPFQEQ